MIVRPSIDSQQTTHRSRQAPTLVSGWPFLLGSWEQVCSRPSRGNVMARSCKSDGLSPGWAIHARPFLAGPCGLLLCAAMSWAQGVPVRGTVEDAAGDPLGGAKLSLSGEVGEKREAESERDGRFAFPDVAPGRYVIHVQARPHLPIEMPLEVTTQPPRPLRIHMRLGIDEEVSVDDVTPDQERTGSANNADALSLHPDFIQGLPTAQGAKGLADLVSSFVSPAAQGTEGASIRVDGADDSAFNIPSDAIRRIKVNRDPYSPTYRRPG